MTVYQCEDSMESVFTAVYRAYEEKRPPEEVSLSMTDEPMLFAEFIPVEPDRERTRKVVSTLWRNFGEDDYLKICMALAAPDPEKGQAVYRTIVHGLRDKCRQGHLFDDLKDDYVRKTFELARGVLREYDHQRGFLRFKEVELIQDCRNVAEDPGGELWGEFSLCADAGASREAGARSVLYARIGPKNHLLTFLMPHFADRFPGENFIIYDESRKIIGIHPAEGREEEKGETSGTGKGEGIRKEQCERKGGSFRGSSGDAAGEQKPMTWYLASCGDGFTALDGLRSSGRELAYQELFTYFCLKIAIRERRNLELQRNMLPLRFREYMTEFQKNMKQ